MLGLVQWFMPAILALGRPGKEEGCRLEASLGKALPQTEQNRNQTDSILKQHCSTSVPQDILLPLSSLTTIVSSKSEKQQRGSVDSWAFH